MNVEPFDKVGSMLHKWKFQSSNKISLSKVKQFLVKMSLIVIK
jgi:hypothetical protein